MEIEGYPNYLIYEDGKVWSKISNKFLKPCLNSVGYYHLVLCKNYKKKTFKIHRLIALHYIPNPDNKQWVDHINRIRTDNRIENLRWVTSSQNNVNRPCVGGVPHKNISKYRDGFDVQIHRKKIIAFRKYCNTLEEALLQRNGWFIENGEEIPD